MTLPRRWLDDDDAPSAVRAALRPGRAGMDPPEGAQDAVWLAVAAQIGAAGAAGAAAKTAASASAKAAAGASASTTAGGGAAAGVTGAVSGGLLKAILIGAFGGVVAVTGYSALEPSPAPPANVAPTVTAPAQPPGDAPAATTIQGAAAAPSTEPSASPEPSASADAQEPPAAGGAPPASQTAPLSAGASSGDGARSGDGDGSSEIGAGDATPAPGSPEERASRLREENELLGQARGALRSGDPGRAMAILETARKKFPGGVLGQEREALTIEALARSGAREAASARAAAFIQAHPTSPHAARLQAFVLP